MNSCTPRPPLRAPRARRRRVLGALRAPLLYAALALGCLPEDAFEGDDIDAAGAGGEAPSRRADAGSPPSGGDEEAGNGATPGEDPGDAPGGAPGESGIFVGMTAAHNATRAELDLPPLEWSPTLASFAQEWSDNLASRCGTIEHRVQRRYGENIALSGTTRLVEPFSAEEAVAGWAAEVACWDYGTINGSESCDSACVQGLNSNGCGHYTQIVWRNTERVGCGYSTCQSGAFTYEVWVCNYDPPGNFIGQAPY